LGPRAGTPYGGRTGMLISPLPTRKETNYSDQTLTFGSHSKTIQKIVRPTSLRGSNDLRVGRKMAIFQLSFSGGSG